ncbi:hypothetical protein DFH07DRAFT_801257 [Mycena maculata]|uniref:HAUS augmin-like complex subunit 6 N-terminal domain-containing protein n=1 Tax=Mycena maculata TaxID=230809 RepID=A0AAD7JZA6_9AGAR|nr:hypothetical protein DFH07DRAFT_801257 [Mycena maculata]
MSANVFSLPVPLILLVHLHILQYPHANKPEYDHNVFDPRVRGLRDRTKTMEDVCYFLVTRIEGKELTRKVISTYPCLQPAEITAFRTSLAKFLENLRHTSIFPSSTHPAKQLRPGTKAISPLAVAWWWKDVVVRKSLLEECAGERFERLLLALSTHALMKGSKSRVAVDETQNILRTQPRIYAARLTTFQSYHNSWARVASRLIQQQRDLKVLHANVLRHGSQKYSTLSTEKLLALADSKLQELRSVRWADSSGRSALNFLSELFGLDQMEASSIADPSPSNPTDPDTSTGPTTPPPALPIAAAHHPAMLRKLSKRIFPKETANVRTPITSRTGLLHATVALSGLLDERARMLRALTDAVARTQKTTTDLRTRLDRATAKQTSTVKRPLRPINMNLWQDTHQTSIDFEPTDATFVALGLSAPGLSAPGSDIPIESRIGEIRRALLPEYPRIPTMPSYTAPSRLPQPLGRRSPPQTPKRARHVETSAPPETVKPRSQPAQRMLDAQRRARNLTMRPSSSDADHRPFFSGPSESGESESECVGEMTPRARPKHSLTMTPPPAQPSLLKTHPLDGGYPYGDQYEDAFDEGPSMSVRDLLLQADTTHFDIIGDSEEDPSDVVNQSFGWA